MADQSVNIGFEKHIWDAACELRGNIDASEYKHVILGLIFLKYVSDKASSFANELRLHEEADPYDKDEYLAENVFYVPTEASWNYLQKHAHTAEIGKKIDNAMALIEKENPRLKGVLPKNFARPELDKRILGNVVDLFTNVEMHDQAHNKDVLGRAYEYCLAMFAQTEGRRGGEYYTPAGIVQTMVEILEPYEGRVYDPACGSGGMFVQSARFLENHSGNLRNISIYGQDSNATTRKLALMNLAIRGIDADLGPEAADTFHRDLHPTLKADFIMANPPFNLKGWGANALKSDVRWKYGVPADGNANYAWIQHMIHHLSDKGKMGLVLANGAVSSNTNSEGDMRRLIVEDDLVECIISMPANLFYTVTIPVTIWILNKDKKQKGKTLFIDARKLGHMESRVLRKLSQEDIDRLAGTYHNFTKGEDVNELGFTAAVGIDEIAKHDFVLTPGRYVGIEEEEEYGEPFEEKMERLKSELFGLFEESKILEERIQQSLKGV